MARNLTTSAIPTPIDFMTPDDPYLVLGVARSCDGDTLKSAYRRLVRENHPDIAPDKEAATLRMTQINAAWALVGDPHKRAAFDLRQSFEERQRRERLASPRSAPAPRPANASPQNSPAKSPSSPRASGSSSTSKSDNRPTPNQSRHARLAEASRLLFKHNKPAEALELCRAILKTDFRNIAARELMGEAYLRLGETDRAIAVWEQALVLAPNNAPLRRRWMQLMSPDAKPAPPRGATSAPVSAPPLPVKAVAVRSRKASSPGLFSRLFGRLKKR